MISSILRLPISTCLALASAVRSNTPSSKNRLTFHMLIKAVGEEESRMMFCVVARCFLAPPCADDTDDDATDDDRALDDGAESCCRVPFSFSGFNCWRSGMIRSSTIARRRAVKSCEAQKPANVSYDSRSSQKGPPSFSSPPSCHPVRLATYRIYPTTKSLWLVSVRSRASALTQVVDAMIRLTLLTASLSASFTSYLRFAAGAPPAAPPAPPG